MFRVLTFFLSTFIFILKFQINEAFSTEYDIRKLNLSDSSFLNFNKILTQSCASKLFSKKVREHSSYPKFGSVKNWKFICKKLNKNSNNKNFIIENFKAISLSDKKQLLTGYYEPTIKISNVKTNIFRYPLLRYSKDMIFERRKINKTFRDQDVLYWTDDQIDLFFLQIQGSGVGEYKSGKKVKISYAGNNGFPYTSIGKVMIEKGYLKKEAVTLQSIKNWLRNNTNRKDEVLNKNKRYIFFKSSPFFKKGPIGAMGRNLIPDISVAIDSKIYPFGIPFVMKTNYKKHDLLAFAHDTGSAIKGFNRADLFVGSGRVAEKVAGDLKKQLLLISLVPIIR
tara:strand:- start:326 stop:1339 length:1014 start_codon:yes stop_codon:yes gene_type:complete